MRSRSTQTVAQKSLEEVPSTQSETKLGQKRKRDMETDMVNYSVAMSRDAHDADNSLQTPTKRFNMKE